MKGWFNTFIEPLLTYQLYAYVTESPSASVEATAIVRFWSVALSTAGVDEIFAEDITGAAFWEWDIETSKARITKMNKRRNAMRRIRK